MSGYALLQEINNLTKQVLSEDEKRAVALIKKYGSEAAQNLADQYNEWYYEKGRRIEPDMDDYMDQVYRVIEKKNKKMAELFSNEVDKKENRVLDKELDRAIDEVSDYLEYEF